MTRNGDDRQATAWERVEAKLDRLKDELVTGLGRETRIELMAAQSLNDDRLAVLERPVEALESKA